MIKTWRKIQIAVRLLVILFVAVYGIYYRANVLDGNTRLRGTVYLSLVGVCIISSLLLTLLPDPRQESSLKRAPSLFSLLFALGCPMYGYLCAELVTTQATKAMGPYSAIIGTSHHSMKYLCLNLLYITMLALFFTAVTGSLKIGPMLGAMGITLFAIVNFYVYTFRGAAITASDIFSATTAANVLGQYQIIPNDRVYLAYWLMILLWSVAFRIRRHIHLLPRHPRLYLGWVLTGLAAFALCVNLFITGPFLYNQNITVSFWNPMKKSYRKIGTALTFTSTIRQAIPTAPEGYSPERAKEIAAPFLDNLEEGSAKETAADVKVSKERPNVLIIVNESFKDLQKLGDFELNIQEYLPFIRSLEKAFPTGAVSCQGYGGRTANTEFEFLTGMNASFLPSDSVPFVTYVKKPLPALAKIFRELGYVGLEGVHPYRANSYSRDKTYPLLGFDPYFVDDLPVEPKLLRKLVSDEGLFENLIYFYQQARKESQAPFFFYTMTMQNHSSYDYKKFENSISPQGLSKEYEDVAQFMTLCQYTDDAMKSLVRYFESTGEPTLILMMGDHQPKLDEGFYKDVEKGQSYETDFAKEYRHYCVNCYLWANFQLPGGTSEVDMSQTSMNYMQLNLLRLLGFPLTPFQEYQAELQKSIPAINRFAYLGADGKTYDFSDENSPYYQQLIDYFTLCYNNLMDSNHRVEDFFGPL